MDAQGAAGDRLEHLIPRPSDGGPGAANREAIAMLQLIKPDTQFDFIGRRRIGYGISAAFILLSILLLVMKGGMRYGIDFAGGTIVQVRFPSPAGTEALRSALAALDLADASIQHFGKTEENEFLIRTGRSLSTDEAFSARLREGLTPVAGADPDIRRLEMVGPQVGQDLREQALLAIFYALLFIAIYISGRFEFKWTLTGLTTGALIGAVVLLAQLQVSVPFLILAALLLTLGLFWMLGLKYAMGAVVSLLHDVIITIGFFALFDKEFTLPIVAAILTIIGYSLNDTIIVYDRIRENLRLTPKRPMIEIINGSVNQTLSRTILTSGTTLLVVIALWMLGGGIIEDFAFALLVGIVAGTYSSVFVASPLLLAWPGRAATK
jgi:preprotein translocase subunit SecF